MRTKILLFLLVSVLFISCFKPEVQSGTLTFRSVLNEDLFKSSLLDTVVIKDLFWRFASFEVSTERIIEGAPDTLEWISVFSDTNESRLSEFQFEAELPPGTYRSLRLAIRNRNWWELEYNDSLVLVEDWNRDSVKYLAENTPYSYHNFQGCWYCDDGTFLNVAPQETISDIVITNGDIVDVVMNWNMYKLVLDIDNMGNIRKIKDWIIRPGHDMIEWDVQY
ncbi:MAG: hypothetical protein WCT23_02695 [Candidatus Neomarinimicrobiota bacterium]